MNGRSPSRTGVNEECGYVRRGHLIAALELSEPDDEGPGCAGGVDPIQGSVSVSVRVRDEDPWLPGRHGGTEVGAKRATDRRRLVRRRGTNERRSSPEGFRVERSTANERGDLVWRRERVIQAGHDDAGAGLGRARSVFRGARFLRAATRVPFATIRAPVRCALRSASSNGPRRESASPASFEAPDAGLTRRLAAVHAPWLESSKRDSRRAVAWGVPSRRERVRPACEAGLRPGSLRDGWRGKSSDAV